MYLYIYVFVLQLILNLLASRNVLEEHVKKLKSEKTAVHSELQQVEERCGNLKHDLELVQERNHSLIETNAELEVCRA